jgi:Spy/CpxP family protein refolding chaperone
MKNKPQIPLLAIALLALGASSLSAQPAAPAGGGAPRAGRGGAGAGGGFGGGFGRGGGGFGGPQQNPLTIENLTSTLTLTEAQVAAIKPLLDEIDKAQQDVGAKQTAASNQRTAFNSQFLNVLTDAQKTSLAVADLLGTYDDHQNMMDQLGITKLRSGKSGSNQTGPGFELATANPWKDTMPELMKMQNGTPVTRADQWPARRAELVELFEREVYGRVPEAAKTIKITWEITGTTQGNVGGTPTITRQLVGHVDNSSYPAITVNIGTSYTIPANATGPVPVLLSFDATPQQDAIAHGWGYGTVNNGSIQADNAAGLRSGIIGLINKGQPRKPDDWGALRAWGWGVGKVIDYFEQHPEAGVNPKAVGITGVSRNGKGALVAQAFDERVVVSLVGSSGEGGAKLHRHDFGEAVENLTGGEYYWMAGNFLKYGTAEGKLGKKDAGDIPVDSHELIALCAPRLCFISYGVEEAGDPKWVGAPGSYMAGILASPAYELLGKKGYGVNPADYITAPMPAVQQLVGGDLAWRQHEGGHTQVPNFPAFFDWIGAYIKAPALKSGN